MSKENRDVEDGMGFAGLLPDKGLVSEDTWPIQPPPLQPLAVLNGAVAGGADIGTVERLCALYERWEDREAKRAHVQALAKFQANCPRIEKRKRVGFETSSGSVEYYYAPLEDIAEQIKEPLAAADLSYRWEFPECDAGIAVSCVVTHAQGHSTACTMTGPPDSSGKKNAIQSRGSTLTYLQRYSLIGALGLSSADQDIDARLYENPEHDATKPKTKPRGKRASEADLGILVGRWKKLYPKSATDKSAFSKWARGVLGYGDDWTGTECSQWSAEDVETCFSQLESEEKEHGQEKTGVQTDGSDAKSSGGDQGTFL